MIKSWIDWSVMGLCSVLLISALVAIVASSTEPHGRFSWTQATIKLLDEGCRTYRLEDGHFPPSDPHYDSRPLHHYLGRPRPVTQADGTQRFKPPIIEFPSRILLNHPRVFSADQPQTIVDEWNHPIRYANPGRYNKGWVDIWSCGPDEAANADPTDPGFAGLINRVREN